MAQVAWAPGSDGRLLYTAAAPKIGAANPLGLPAFVSSRGNDEGLILASPAGPALTPEDGRQLGTVTGLAAPTWLAGAGPGGAHVLALVRSDRGSKPQVVRG